MTPAQYSRQIIKYTIMAYVAIHIVYILAFINMLFAFTIPDVIVSNAMVLFVAITFFIEYALYSLIRHYDVVLSEEMDIIDNE